MLCYTPSSVQRPALLLTMTRPPCDAFMPCIPCRPDRNAARIAAGAARLSMPPFPEARFVEAVAECVRANAGAA
jgi:hypothetical protein